MPPEPVSREELADGYWGNYERGLLIALAAGLLARMAFLAADGVR